MIYLVSTNKNLDAFKKLSVQEAITKLEKFESLAVDSETTGLDFLLDRILLFAMGNMEDQIVIDCTTIDLRLFRDLIEKKTLILQNAKFDLKFLFRLKIVPKKVFWDTMLAEQCLYNGLEPIANLAHLVQKYYGGYLSKEIRENIPNLGVTSETIMYVAKDIEFLHFIMEKQYAEAVEKEIIVAIELENRFVSALAYIEFCGLYLDQNKWKVKVQNAKKDLAVAEKKLTKYVIDNNLKEFIDPQLDLFSTEKKTLIQWSSPKQVTQLFKKIGINVDADNKSGEGISEPILKKQQDDFVIIPMFLDYQGIRKDFTTYGEAFLESVHKATGRIHCDFTQLMVTSRLSSSKPNLQNLPRDSRTRSCFTPQYEDTILVVGDYKAQEDVVFVNRSKEKKMIEFYKLDNADGHSYVAKMCFPEQLKDVPLEEVKSKFPDLRSQAKTAKFAIHYSGVGKTIAENLNIPIERGNEIYKAYTTAFPDITNYLKEQQEKAKRKGYIRTSTVTGRKVWCKNYEEIMEEEDHKALYEFSKLACNYPIQTESAEITKIAATYMYEWIIGNNMFNKVRIVNLIHDEIMIECPTTMAKYISEKLKEFMEHAGSFYCQTIPLTAEPIITDHWLH